VQRNKATNQDVESAGDLSDFHCQCISRRFIHCGNHGRTVKNQYTVVLVGAITTTTEQQEESGAARRQRPRSHSCPLLTTVLSSGSVYQTSFSPLRCCQGHLLLQHTSLKRCGVQETIFHAQRTVLYLP
jgi:hypothetical protein